MRHYDDKECIAKSKQKLAQTLAGVGRTCSKVVAPGGAAGSDAGSDDDRFNVLDAADKLRGIYLKVNRTNMMTVMSREFSKARVSENKDSRKE